MGNCAACASRNEPPRGSAKERKNIAKAVSIPRINLVFQVIVVFPLVCVRPPCRLSYGSSPGGSGHSTLELDTTEHELRQSSYGSAESADDRPSRAHTSEPSSSLLSLQNEVLWPYRGEHGSTADKASVTTMRRIKTSGWRVATLARYHGFRGWIDTVVQGSRSIDGEARSLGAQLLIGAA